MNIVLYSTGCPRCNVLKKKLDTAGINYEVCTDVPKMLSMGIKAAPYLGVDEELMDFGKAVKWVGEYNG